MDNWTMLIAWAPFLFYLIFVGMRVSNCPNCRERLCGVISPFKKARRQWIEGGYVCPKCGCEVNLAGKKVPANTPLRYRPFVASTIMLSLLIVLAAGLTYLALHLSA